MKHLSLDRARNFATLASGPVTCIIDVEQYRGLPAYTIGRTFWSPTFEEALGPRIWSLK